MKLLKKVLIIIALITVLLLISSSKVSAKILIVNTDTLKLRKEASTNSTTLELLNNGQNLEYIEESGDWYKVKINNKTGYVHKDYIKVQEEQNETKNNEQDEQNTNVQENNIVTTTTNTVEEVNQPSENVDNKEQKEYEPQKVNLQKDTNAYILPLINSNILENIKKGKEVTILNEINGWLYIETEEINAWIVTSSVDLASLDKEKDSNISTYTENPQENNSEPDNSQQQNNVQENKEKEESKVTKISEKTMYVNTSSIYVRKGPSTNNEVVDSLILNASVIVTGEIEDWYQVKVDGKTGYIAKRLLSNSKTEVTTRNSEERSIQKNNVEENDNNKAKPLSSKGEEIVDYAKKYLGCKYVYGASGPSTFDCSGFTMYVFKHFGVSLSHSATAQSKKGTYVSKENLQLGDLVFFKDYETMDGIGHCGIYIGDGNFIHASSGTGYCVKISTLLSGSYNKRYETARRIF